MSCMRTLKERSTIALNVLDLCGIIAMGDIFNSGGELCLILSHRTTSACPFLTFSAASCASCVIASGSRANACGPHSTAIVISFQVQGLPVLTRQPPKAYCSKLLAAGWCNTRPLGHMLLHDVISGYCRGIVNIALAFLQLAPSPFVAKSMLLLRIPHHRLAIVKCLCCKHHVMCQYPW